jgi:hypothetical protein
MDDILANIFTFLQVKDILQCSTVCKTYYKVCSLQMVWKSLLFDRYKNHKYFRENYYDSYIFYHKITKLKKNINHYENKDEDIVYERVEADLCNKNLRCMPSELSILKNLQRLYLAQNKLKKIPSEIGQLCNLSKLFIHLNYLIEIPSELGLLHNLEELHLDNNYLEKVPPELGALQKLRVLDLGYNRLIEIPPEFGNLCNLRYMYLNNNNIKTLPSELQKCKNIICINFKGYHITNFGDWTREYGHIYC